MTGKSRKGVKVPRRIVGDAHISGHKLSEFSEAVWTKLAKLAGTDTIPSGHRLRIKSILDHFIESWLLILDGLKQADGLGRRGKDGRQRESSPAISFDSSLKKLIQDHKRMGEDETWRNYWADFASEVYIKTQGRIDPDQFMLNNMIMATFYGRHIEGDGQAEKMEPVTSVKNLGRRQSMREPVDPLGGLAVDLSRVLNEIAANTISPRKLVPIIKILYAAIPQEHQGKIPTRVYSDDAFEQQLRRVIRTTKTRS